ncbi:MAG: Holliday junction resolvase RecU [Eubacteriales bacterium]|nr:Holliday junction resolvase RecU [Eubacteriales bacterium]
MAWKSRGLRGSVFEDLINRSNEVYLEQGLALIQKIPTPITPIRMDKESRHITLAYFEQKSTVDYIGVVQGIAVCFDAKECATDTFALQNVHAHQMEFMRQFERQDGLAFFLIYYTSRDEIYYVPFADMERFWQRMENGGRKSFRFEEIDQSFRLQSKSGVLVPFLEGVKRDLMLRDE